MRTSSLLLLLSIIVSSCSQNLTPAASSEAKRYPLKGKVISVDRAAKRAKIEHQEIEGFMEAMTMDFPIREDWVWDDLTPGSEVRAELVVDNSAKEPYWLEKIGIIAAPDPNRPAPPPNDKFAQIGKPVPDFSLTNQDGERISLESFRGRALSITFIYSQCPLADYCIKMSTNFSDLANQLAARPDGRKKFALLSISFDPARDTPEKLRDYGVGYLGNPAKPDFSIWQLAVGKDSDIRPLADFFGLRYELDKEDRLQFNHSLRTAVIDPDGKVTKIFSGNDWTPSDLLKELEATLR